MKTKRSFGLRAALALSSLLAGCTAITPSGQTQLRIQEKRDVYNALTSKQQNDILGGAVERGNTADMVYMALGKPTKVVTSADGQKAMWVYVEYYPANGPTTTGFNSHGSQYRSQVVAPNTPYGGNIKATAPMGFASTSNVMIQELDIPDLQSKTVYVFFLAGKVVEIKTAEQAPENHSGASRDSIKRGA